MIYRLKKTKFKKNGWNIDHQVHNSYDMSASDSKLDLKNIFFHEARFEVVPLFSLCVGRLITGCYINKKNLKTVSPYSAHSSSRHL